MLDLVVEDMDIAHREELVKRIRSLTGQRDPDAEELTPEEQAQAEAKAIRDKMQMDLFAANIRKVAAEAGVKEAQAADMIVKLKQNGIDALLKALSAGAQAIQMPAAAHVADHILMETGNAPQPGGHDLLPPPQQAIGLQDEPVPPPPAAPQDGAPMGI
jgi:hypothetical protein